MSVYFLRGSIIERYFLINPLVNTPEEVSESEFIELIGHDRYIVPMKYDENDINRRNFFLNDVLIGFIIRERI